VNTFTKSPAVLSEPEPGTRKNIMRRFIIKEISAVDTPAQAPALAAIMKNAKPEAAMDAMEKAYAEEHGVSLFEAACSLAHDPQYNALFQKSLEQDALGKRRDKMDGLDTKGTPAGEKADDDDDEEDDDIKITPGTRNGPGGIKKPGRSKKFADADHRARQKQMAEDMIQKRVEDLRLDDEPEYETHDRLARTDRLYQQAYQVAYEYS